MADYVIHGGARDTVFLVESSTEELRQHLAFHVQEDSLWLGKNLSVEHRYIEQLAKNLIEEGFSVEWGGEVF